MRQLIVTNLKTETRLDLYIASNEENMSRECVQRLINEYKITVNGKKCKASYKVKENDNINIEEDIPKETKIEAQDIDVQIIYEDNDIVVVNKPKGLVVHPGNGNEDGTLVNAMMHICKESLSGIGGEIRPGIVHRLDKDTSGVLIVAKNDFSHINLSERIKNHEVQKTYIALVRGNVKANEATIDMPIGRSLKDRKKMSVRKDGKKAVTHFKVLKRYNNYTLLEVKIETGRTHQIRVHLSEIGYPIIGDYIYSNGKNEFGIEGQCLHSYNIKFKHPTTGKNMDLTAELPEYFSRVISYLDNIQN